MRGFYKGMSANLIRILPATCVTFVVYENVSWGLKGAARKRDEKRLQQQQQQHHQQQEATSSS